MNSKKDIYIKSILDKIYIIPSIQEKWAILNENKPPVIRNIHPAKNSKYRK